MINKKKVGTCLYCGYPIYSNQKYIDLVTHNVNEKDVTESFHFKCFVKWQKKLAQKSMKNIANKSFNIAQKLLGMKGDENNGKY